MEHNLTDHVRTGWQKKKKPILIVGGIVIGAALLICAGSFAYGMSYEGRIYPNISIDSMDVGGLTQEEAYQLVDAKLQEMLDDGLIVEVEGATLTIDLRASGSDDPDLISDRLYVDVDGAVEDAMNLGRERSASPWPSVKALGYLFGNGPTLSPDVTVLDDELEETIRELLVARELDTLEDPGESTHYIIGENDELAVVEGTTGQAYDFKTFFVELKEAVEQFDLSEITLHLVDQTVDVTESDAATLRNQMIWMTQATPFELTHTAQNRREYTWEVDKDDVLSWVAPTWDEEELTLTLEGEAFDNFMEELHDTIDVDATDARFQIEGSRVTEFTASLNGVAVDDDGVASSLMWVLELGDTADELVNEPVEIATLETEADITTNSVNNLGINEILGVGVSDFSGSPSNRIKNITHGADKLNGILLAPGETLSLVDSLGPFTVADGYLPELVIKGDEIKAEVGGGLCQIGTTTFRATMNAGLEVTARRNHSLVVSYYNDPSNGNPGTDATIYDPAPDYQMTNDTENYILLTTEVDLYNYELIFTFWGTSDGREGYYSPPEVLSWSGYGETQYIETLDLAPGVENCQSPHPGATTSFTYYVDYNDGEQHEKTYTSVYRSLPYICLVGVETLTVECEEGDETCEAAVVAEEGSDDAEADDSAETDHDTESETSDDEEDEEGHPYDS